MKMKKVIKLTEGDLNGLVKKIISEMRPSVLMEESSDIKQIILNAFSTNRAELIEMGEPVGNDVIFTFDMTGLDMQCDVYITTNLRKETDVERVPNGPDMYDYEEYDVDFNTLDEMSVSKVVVFDSDGGDQISSFTVDDEESDMILSMVDEDDIMSKMDSQSDYV